jgi:hypothetical protein
LGLTCRIGSSFLTLFLHGAIRLFDFSLPFLLLGVAVSAATFAFALTFAVLFNPLPRTVLVLSSDDRLRRHRKTCA